MNIYSPAVALEFFKAAGKPEKAAKGTVIFAEHDKARRRSRRPWCSIPSASPSACAC